MSSEYGPKAATAGFSQTFRRRATSARRTPEVSASRRSATATLVRTPPSSGPATGRPSPSCWSPRTVSRQPRSVLGRLSDSSSPKTKRFKARNRGEVAQRGESCVSFFWGRRSCRDECQVAVSVAEMESAPGGRSLLSPGVVLTRRSSFEAGRSLRAKAGWSGADRARRAFLLRPCGLRRAP